MPGAKEERSSQEDEDRWKNKGTAGLDVHSQTAFGRSVMKYGLRDVAFQKKVCYTSCVVKKMW
jgi:hypothetical protein